MKIAVPKNADPNFRPKLRKCGTCGRRMTTTPLRRYMCLICYRGRSRVGRNPKLLAGEILLGASTAGQKHQRPGDLSPGLPKWCKMGNATKTVWDRPASVPTVAEYQTQFCPVLLSSRKRKRSFFGPSCGSAERAAGG